MKFSAKAQYGLRACFLIGTSHEKIVSLKTLVKRTGISEKYLEQILGILKTNNVLDSNRGASGGYFLAREAKDITMREILSPLEDDFMLVKCIEGTCSEKTCPSRNIFYKIFDGINGLLDGISLQEMIDDFVSDTSDINKLN